MNKQYNIGLCLLRIFMSFEVVLQHFIIWREGAPDTLSITNKLLFYFQSLAVPVFIFMSFSLVDLATITSSYDRFRRRIYRLIMPHVFWAIAYYFVFWIWNSYDNIYESIRLLGYQIFFGCSLNPTAWFQVDLIVLTLLFAILYLLPQRYRTFIIAFLVTVSIYLQYSEINYHVLQNTWLSRSFAIYTVGRLLELLPIAAAGVLFCQNKILNRIKSKGKSAIAICLVLIVLFFRIKIFVPIMGYGCAGMEFIILSILITVLFYCIPFDIIPKTIIRIIVEISQYSMGVYFIHRLVGQLLYSTGWLNILRVNKGSLCDCLIIYIFSLAISWGLYRIPIKWIKDTVG